MAESFPIRFGRYELVERLAVGGMAELFLANADGEHGFAKSVVIKRLLPHLATEAGYTAMFIDEAKLTARLVHPKIAQTFELGRVDSQLFIAMELVDGVDVLAMLREFAHRRERVPVDLAVWIAHEVVDALDYAHHLADADGRPMAVVHRDISPSNILLSKRGDVKLVDFGIARASEPGRHHRTKSGTLKGKYGYMSPEQVLEQQVDARSDLFSLGIVLAEMLCGRRLFAAPNELDVLLMVRDAKLARLDEHGKHLDPGLDAIVRKTLKKDPGERWNSAGEMRDALEDWLFNQRLRVTPRKVAEAVESVYDNVWSRRRALSAGAGVAEPSDEITIEPASEAPPPRPRTMPPRAPTSHESPRAIAHRAKRASTSPDDADGVPRGLHKSTDSLPVLTYEDPPMLEVAQPTRSPGGSGRLKVMVPPLPAAPRPVVDDDDDDFARALAGLDRLGDELDDEPAMITSPAPPGAPPLAPVREPLADHPSVRYPSIEAAVSALSRKEREQDRARGKGRPHDEDASTLEFDSGEMPPRRKPTGEVRAITEEELAAAVARQPPALAEIEETPEENGDFTRIPPLKLLYWLMSTRKTGLLVTTVGAIRKEIYVRDGMPEYVSSNVSSELFGNYLVSQGVLSQGELAMALAMMPHYGGKLGDTLVGLGLLKPLEVFRHLTRQVRQKLIDVCTWSKGGFSWYAGRENPREAFPLDLNAFEVLGAGAMALPESSVDAWLERMNDSHLRATKGAKFGPDRFELAGLRGLYDGLDGKKTVEQVLSRFTDESERRRTLRMLVLLEMCELARV